MIPALHHGECSWIYPVRAAPPGVFVLHNGMGTVAKRLNHIPTTDPMRVRILLDNPLYVSYEDTAEEVNIIGGYPAVQAPTRTATLFTFPISRMPTPR